MGEYNIGQFIYRSRKAVGLTQEQLCHNEDGVMCFSVETLSRIERGKQRPNYRTMREIMHRLGKENCFCTPYLKTADYRVLEIKRELKRAIALNNYRTAEELLEQMEDGLSLEYMTNKQYLIRTHALIDRRLGRITIEEELELMEIALEMSVNCYKTRAFSYFILLPEEIVIVCNIACCYGKLGNTQRALELLKSVDNMLNNETLQINSYPSGIREMVSRNHILWIGEQGGYCEAILECNRAIADCVRRATLNTLPSLYYARAYNMQKFREVYPECLSDVENKIKLDYIRCALLAELILDQKGQKKALSRLEECNSLN